MEMMMRIVIALLVALAVSGCAVTQPDCSAKWEYRFICPDEVEKIMRVPVGQRPETGDQQIRMRVDRIIQWLNSQGDEGWEAFQAGDEGVWLKRRKK